VKDRPRTRRFGRMPSPATVIACIALMVALSGTGYAVTALPRNSVGTAQLKANAVKSAKVAANTLNGGDINEATLGRVPLANSANLADTAANATNAQSAANADRLDTLDSTDFLRANGKAADAETLDGQDSTKFAPRIREVDTGVATSIAAGECVAVFLYGVGSDADANKLVAFHIVDAANQRIQSINNETVFLPGVVFKTSQGGTLGYGLVCNPTGSPKALSAGWKVVTRII
jgi:hypothetical protein